MTGPKYGFILAALLAMTSGCDRGSKPDATERGAPVPSDQSATTTAPSTAPAADDLAAIGRMVAERSRTASSDLPPGHPPLGPAPSAASAPVDSATASMPALPLGHPAVPGLGGMPAGGPGAPAGPGGAGQAELHVLKYDPPQRWQPQPPTNTMRIAQWAIPPAEGAGTAGEMALFRLGPRAGTVELNVERWIRQFKTETGEPVPQAAVRQEVLEVDGLRVTLVEVTGHYDPGMMAGGTGEPSSEPQHMLAAVVEGPGGLWFFKGVGPVKTMENARGEFEQMIRSVHK